VSEAGPRAGQAGTIVEIHEDAHEVELNDAEGADRGRRRRSPEAKWRPTCSREIANVIAFPASEANGRVTGESIRVDGHFPAVDPNGTA